MRVDDAQQAIQTLQSADSTQALRDRLQASLLKKTLENQQEQAAELLRLMEGKGRVIDIRV